MPVNIQPRSGKWQLRVKHSMLPKPFFSTFIEEDEARAYGVQLESLLDRGIIPVELLDSVQRGEDPLLYKLLTDYEKAAPIAPTDLSMVVCLKEEEGAVRLSAVTASWADAWVVRLRELAPGTIRKRVECLARAIDWYWRSRELKTPAINPLRMMPKGYSSVSVKRDAQRNRRLTDEEFQRCHSSLRGVKNMARERAYPVDGNFALLFDLIVHTGLRLSEAFALRVDQVDMIKWIIRVEGSKGHRGLIKPRMVPLVPALRTLLGTHCQGKTGLMFPFWDGLATGKKKASAALSARFSTLFAYAEVQDFREHDLRHEATCRWFELRRPDGAWVFSEIEVCRILGWSDTRMVLRYASLRGEDLSSRLG